VCRQEPLALKVGATANLLDLDAKYADVVAEAEAIEKLQVGW
jgi:hypothetical protein